MTYGFSQVLGEVEFFKLGNQRLSFGLREIFLKEGREFRCNNYYYYFVTSFFEKAVFFFMLPSPRLNSSSSGRLSKENIMSYKMVADYITCTNWLQEALISNDLRRVSSFF